jgi:hypothetical protein
MRVLTAARNDEGQLDVNTIVRCAAVGIACSLVPAVGTLGCGGAAPAVQAPVHQQTPEEEIHSIATAWEARFKENGLRSEPSKISVFNLEGLSTLEFTPGKLVAREGLLLEETFRMRDGRQFACRVEGVLQVQVRYFQKGEEPAVEVTRPVTELTRHCDQPGFPEPLVNIGSTKSSFLLREEHLLGFDPPLEKRSYIPVH